MVEIKRMPGDGVSGWQHFEVEQLADGVWAAIYSVNPPSPQTWAISNAGIVDLGDRTLVFDALMTPHAAAELRDAAEELTSRSPDYLAYSHHHNDHIWGGQQFPATTVIATTSTRHQIESEGPAEITMFRDVHQERLAHWQDLTSADNPVDRAAATFSLPYWEAVAAALPELELRLPDVTFTDRLHFHGADRRVELVTVGAAHSSSDTILHLVDDGVVFASDLLFFEFHPYLAESDLPGLRAAWEYLESLGADRYVPGHGPVGTTGAIQAIRGYLDDIVEIVGDSSETPADTAIPGKYASWAGAPIFETNLQTLATRQAQSN